MKKSLLILMLITIAGFYPAAMAVAGNEGAAGASASATATVQNVAAGGTGSLDTAQTKGDPMELIKKGAAILKRGNLGTAEVLFSNAYDLAREQNNNDAQMYACLYLDQVYSAQGYKDKAISNLEALAALPSMDSEKLSGVYLKLGGLCLDTGKYSDSVKYLKLAKGKYTEIGKTSKLPYIDNSTALACAGMGEFGEAEKLYSSLLDSAKSRDSATDTIRVLSNMGDLCRTRSDYSTALAKYQEALDIARKKNRPADIVLLLNNIALTHQYLTDLDTARASLDEAVKIAQDNNDERGLAATYHQLGILKMHGGEVNAAIDDFNKSIELKTKLKDPTIGNTLAELGRAFYFRGNYKPARRNYNEAIKAGLPVDVEITVDNNMAMVYKMQGMLDYALESFKQSLVKARQYNLRYQESFLLNNIGVVQREMGLYDDALTNHEAALKIDQDVGAKLDALVDVNNIALAYKMKGDYDKALELLNGVIATARGLGSYDDFVRTLVNLADVYYAKAGYDDALKYYTEAADVSEKIMSQERQWNALYGLGNTYYKKGDTDKAIESLKKAVDVIENLRAGIGDEGDEKSYFLVDKVKVYSQLIILLFMKGDFGDALDYLERMKSRSLLDLIQKGRARVDKGMSDEETAREKQLQAQLAAATQALGKALADKGADSPEARAAKDALNKARKDSGDFKQALYVTHPKLAFARGENKPVSYAEVQAALSPDEIVVAYMLGDETSYAWTVTKESVKMYDLGIPGEKIDFMIDKKLRDALENGVWGAPQERAAKKLYETVIAPFEADLKGKKVMGVLPDSRLYEIPFYLMMDGEGKYMIDKIGVYYIPSLSVMVETRRSKAGLVNDDKLLAFGNPKFERSDLVQLPGTEEEVKKISEVFGDRATSYYHEQALEEYVKYFGKKYRIIHLATHGLLNNNNPMFSSIAMSEVKDQKEDGYLEAGEIMNLDLNSELVVMSACESGRGKLRAGEGILGLTRSFFSAGVPSVVASLWSVNDLATSFMMQSFYSKFESMNSVEALREAQIATRDQIDPNPNKWAPFVIMGYGIEGGAKAAAAPTTAGR